MADDVIFEDLYDTHGLTPELGLFQRVTFPPGSQTVQRYSRPYVVLAVTKGTLKIQVNDDTAYEQSFEPGDHYLRPAAADGEEFTMTVGNETSYPIVVLKG
ncbi:hypothetical protein [Sedimentitalea arenosa]|uniref:Uncharacterized protein n=1 Tax=Sedimentitalea arenosa TaxID=2798803 RepID=A0A8J7JBN9_9RHOB|nr:hypothetical protein [Arenibacterium arenosum]MBJ6371789.1 hypothetical protein [Arenibacterium arenosum]